MNKADTKDILYNRLSKEDIALFTPDIVGVDFGDNTTDTLELHVFDLENNYVVGSHDEKLWRMVPDNDYPNVKEKILFLDIHTAIRQMGILRGQYNFTLNFIRPLLGRYTGDKLFVYDVSKDKTELVLRYTNPTSKLPRIADSLNSYFDTSSKYYPDMILNFGNNEISKIINLWTINDEIYVKLYEPYEGDAEKSKCWIGLDIKTPYTDQILLLGVSAKQKNLILSGPNFDVLNTTEYNSQTILKSWEDLVGTDAKTSQLLIDEYFHTSLDEIKLNIDYSLYENFIHYSSANERLKNFHYKMQLIENYNSQIDDLNNAVGDVQGNVETITKTRDAIISAFDRFEKFLYFDLSAGLFTYSEPDITPWPKEINGDPKSVLDQDVIDWYEDVLESSTYYDRINETALRKTIPQAMQLESANDDYVLFVDMIAQHFDIIWSYINHMTRLMSREEHPKLGMPDGLLYTAAKSFGWNLENGQQLSNLWEYILGTDESGTTLANDADLTVKPHRDLTQEVWRRIVNNMPYLLKSKGTARGIKALMSCYGMPASILSIREYGGPKTGDGIPTIVANKYMNGIRFGVDDSNQAYGSWNTTTRSGSNIYPSTIEIQVNPGNSVYDIVPSGSIFKKFGREFRLSYTNTGAVTSDEATIEFVLVDNTTNEKTMSLTDVPLLDGQYSAIMITRSGSLLANEEAKYELTFKKAKYGKVVYEDSASILIDPGTTPADSEYNTTWFTTGDIYLAPTGSEHYTGELQEFRYYNVPLDQSTFDSHVLSPLSYHSNESELTFWDLVLRMSLGDNTEYPVGYESVSIHPDQTEQTYSDATSKNWTFEITSGSGTWEDVNVLSEIEHHTQGPMIGAQNRYPSKIRLDDNLLYGRLSLQTRVEKSMYDKHPIDLPNLGVYFSPQDQINEDIFYQYGFIDLDNYIGSPADIYKPNYRELEDFATNYWQKYNDKNDFSSYIRLFSVYDFTLFSQLKQLIPYRAVEKTGILIEPNILERNKVANRAPGIEYIPLEFELPVVGDELMSGELAPLAGTIDTGATIEVIGELMPSGEGVIIASHGVIPAKYHWTNDVYVDGSYVDQDNAYWVSRAIQLVITSSIKSSQRFSFWSGSFTAGSGSFTPFEAPYAIAATDKDNSSSGSHYIITPTGSGFETTTDDAIESPSNIESYSSESAVSGNQWTNFKDIASKIGLTLDNTFFQCTYAGIQGYDVTDKLKFTLAGIGSRTKAYPGETITNIKVDIRAVTSVSSSYNFVTLDAYQGGWNNNGDNLASADPMAFVPTTQTYESVDWGILWDLDDILANGMDLVIQFESTQIPTISVDMVNVTVYTTYEQIQLSGTLDDMLTNTGDFITSLIPSSTISESKSEVMVADDFGFAITASATIGDPYVVLSRYHSGSMQRTKEIQVVIHSNPADNTNNDGSFAGIFGNLAKPTDNTLWWSLNTGLGTPTQIYTYNNTPSQDFTPTEINTANFGVGYQFQIDTLAHNENVAVVIEPMEIHVPYTYLTSSTEYSWSQDTPPSQSIVFEFAEYNDMLPIGVENHRYNGCKLTANAMNEPSDQTPDGSPVIEKISTNNQPLLVRPKITKKISK